MTTKDKTGDQLMASIRKAKTEGATPAKAPADAPQATAVTPKAAAAPKAKPTAATGAAKRPRVAKKEVAARPKPPPAGSSTGSAGYQSSGRVWPD